MKAQLAVDAVASALLVFVACAPPVRAQEPEPRPEYQAVLKLGVVRGEGSTAPLAAVVFETRQAEIGAGVRLALDFDAGHEPRLAMMKLSGQPLAPAYLNGWTTSAAIRVAHASSSSEASIVGRAGSSRPDSVNDAAANETGRWAAFFDARAELRWYRRDMSEVYRSADALMPIVQAYGGIRHDQRFHRAGDLASFNDPTARWFIGAVVSPFRLGPVSLGAGFDFETAVRATDRLPSGLKFAIRGDLDLKKALRRNKRT